MSTETSIQDLPDEMLEQILLFLNLDDRRSALQVCRRWSTLIPLSSDKLVVDFELNRGQEANYHRTLLASSRQYKHLEIHFGSDSDKFKLLVEILQHFSRKVETLEIISTDVTIKQKLITQILSLCSNLRNLHIGSCYFDFGPHGLEILPMHKLEELYLRDSWLELNYTIMNIMPNITRLHMRWSYFGEAEMLLRHFSSQLVELKIRFLSMLHVRTVCEMQFPLLEKLNFYCDDSEYYPGSFLDEVERMDLFFHKSPRLKTVTLRCDFNDRVIQNLCRSCVNIQALCVSIHLFSQDIFRAVCELKHLKRLRIEKATVDVPPDMYSPQTSLRKLTLNSTRISHRAKLNSFVQRAFPNLAELELLNLRYVNYEVKERSFEHGQICSNIPSLQCLVISEPDSDVLLSQFLEFCASYAPKELRFKCKGISGHIPNFYFISENETPNRIPVQKLVLDSPMISSSVLQKLISSMGELRWLEQTFPDDYSPEVISSLRERFPRCILVPRKRK